MEIINEHKLGVAKGTAVEQDVDMNFKGETAEVFDESSRDEARHARMLQGLLDRYFK